ncbi:similar to Vanderwaltozyma polyspora Kpol_1028p70 hypothetical protein [Maudiozyma saulgeensis]|uniref:Uncharacterized protein n=1 Tax=Maudiozyma saulgeensis TaxID=1789683 RepID=A0A1X7R9W7_9SACH|nr:similar to Vanderwaltozyma polyspora Kpol_1028p70 hypothetical protein [Kazachstania saulgeensis]
MQALIEKANQSGHYLPQDQNQSWEFRWFSPLKEQHLAHTQPQQTADEENKYPFQYKTWLRKQPNTTVDVDNVSIEEPSDSTKIDTLIPLNLSQFNRAKYSTNNNGLSVDDIRGAVGGSESIPGLSSSNAATTVERQTVETPVEESPVTTVETPSVETPVEETPAAIETPAPIDETPIVETPAGETPTIEETPVIESPSNEPTKEESVVDSVPESQDIEMKD